MRSEKHLVLIKLFREFKPYRGRVAIVVALGLVISAIQPLSVRLSQKILDELQRGVDNDWIRWVPGMLVLLFFVSGIAKYLHQTVRRYMAENIIIRLRSGLFERYLYLPMSFVDSQRTGELMARAQNDLEKIASGIDTLCDLLREPFTFFGLLGVAFYYDWRLTLCTLLVAPLVGLLFSRSGNSVKRYSMRNLQQFSDLMSICQESLVGSRVVKIFTLEPTLLRKLEQIHARYLATVWKSIRVQEMAVPLVEFVGALLMAGVIAYGGTRIASGALTAGELVGFIIAIGLAQMPIKKLNNSYLKIKAAEAAAERVYEVLDRPEALRQISGDRRIQAFENSIVYQDVALEYGAKVALKGVSFEVARGQCVAFVGPSGSGKTSIVNLLPRLYDFSRGEIFIDGVGIRQFVLEDLRKLISVVTQDTFLFHDSIYENIRYGRPGASDDEIAAAAEAAYCTDFIAALPGRMDFKIGDRGACLSGGEKQRVAIARAILKDAPILILDEATSSLDTQSEGIVQKALDRLMTGRTSLVVAHRLSTVRKAQKIFVVDQGRIEQVGSHDHLVGSQGIYRTLFEHQFQEI